MPAGPGTGYSCSPETCRVARLVTTILMPGRGPEQVGDDRRRRDDLLEVVEHEQDAACRAASRRATRRSAGRRSPTTPTRRAIRGATSIGSRIGSSGDEEDAVREVVRRRARRAGATAGSCRCRPGPVRVSSRVVASSVGGLGQLGVAADEGRQLGRQVVRVGRRASGAAGSRTAGRRRSTWTRRSGASRSLSRYAPRSRSVTPAGRCVAEQAAGRVRDRIWPPWADRRDPRRPVDVEADAALPPRRLGLAGVEAHPDPDRRVVRPGLARRAPRWPATAAATPPRRSGRRRRTSRPRCPARSRRAACERRAEDRAVALAGARRSARVPIALLEARRALDVAEQEGDGPARPRLGLGHRGAPSGVGSVVGALRSGRAAAPASPRRIASATRGSLEQDRLEVPRREGQAGRRPVGDDLGDPRPPSSTDSSPKKSPGPSVGDRLAVADDPGAARRRRRRSRSRSRPGGRST